MSRYRRRRRCWRRRDRRNAVVAVVLGLAMAVLARSAPGHGSAAAASTGTGAPSGTAAKVIAYAKAELGQPYVWGGTGAGGAGYDCSGLAMEAFLAAGVTIPRTSQEQWAWGPQVAHPRPGDLVFFAGSDGTMVAPGHVGVVVGRHLMIDAYGSGYGVEEDTFGLPGDAARGLADPVGFTDPMAHPGAR